jgi:hypothetical protein
MPKAVERAVISSAGDIQAPSTAPNASVPERVLRRIEVGQFVFRDCAIGRVMP